MKKIVTISILGLTSVLGFAQEDYSAFRYDALRASESEYEGTARTLAMGNAFTALGGDLGSIGINPAGSAVAGYSQMTLTPALSISASTSKGILPNGSANAPYFEREMRKSTADFGISNLGVTLNYKTGRSSGLKNITLGFVVNQTASWNEDLYANGTNNKTSFMGAMAYRAGQEKWTHSEFWDDEAYYYWNYPAAWKLITGYRSGMIWEDGNGGFIGGSQLAHTDKGKTELIIPGTLEQSFGRRIEGAKHDYVLNFGANISDFIYIGANFGMTTLEYSYKEYFKESAADPHDFKIPITDTDTGENRDIYFNEMTYSYSQRDSGVGYYGKFGIILTPGGGLRIGAAIQTPTITKVSMEYYMGGETSYTDYYYDPVETPSGFDDYTITSPFRANFGLAYTFGQFGVISADYELCDYGSMKYRDDDIDDWNWYEKIDADMRKEFRTSHMLRIGAEIKPLTELAIRAGYGFTTDPEEYIYSEGLSMFKSQNLSLGLGYSSKGSFFADFAVRRTFLPDEYAMPYDDYIFKETVEGEIYPDPGYYSPRILNSRSLWKVLLTIGWRF